MIGAVVAVAGAWIGVAELHDNSFLTHLATGRLILDSGTVPTADPYSFTAPGEPWVVQSWLASLLYGGLERWWGFDGIRILTAALSAAVAVIIWSLTRRADSVLVRLGVTLVALLAAAAPFAERPLMFGYVGFGLCLLVVHRGLDPRWLLPMGWIWVNTHGSFPLGLVVLATVVVGQRLDGQRRPEALPALGWLSLGLLAGAVNPLGPRLLVFPFQLLGRSSFLSERVAEWQSPSFGTWDERAFLGLVLLALLVAPRARRFALLVPAAVLVGAALVSQRNIPLATMTLMPLIAAGVPSLGSIRTEQRRAVHGPALVAVAAIGVVSLLVAVRGPDVDLEAYPVEEITALDDRGLVGVGARLVTHDFVGNYLTARFGDDAQVFLDDRFDMYPRAVLDDYVALRELDDPERVLERWEAGAVVWRADEPLAEWLAQVDGWTAVSVDEDYVVYCRVGDPRCDG